VLQQREMLFLLDEPFFTATPRMSPSLALLHFALFVTYPTKFNYPPTHEYLPPQVQAPAARMQLAL